jgi:hypothetical protein
MTDERSGLVLFAAGFAGSLVDALHRQKSLRETVIHLICGTASAGFLTPLVFQVTAIDPSPNLQSAMAFLMGILGMRVVDMIVRRIFPDSKPFDI